MAQRSLAAGLRTLLSGRDPAGLPTALAPMPRETIDEPLVREATATAARIYTGALTTL